MEKKYLDPNLSIEERVESLMGQMTIEEKISQLMGDIFPYGKENFPAKVNDDGTLEKNDSYAEKIKYGLGGIAYVNLSIYPEDSVKYTNAIQKDIIENTRLGIPLFIFEECLYGEVSLGATRFPLPIGFAATWDTELVQQCYDAVAREVRSRGGNMNFGPILDIGRDARWGRVQETFGEDTYLAARMGVAAVKGYQGGDELASDHIASTVKHFAGFGQSTAGRQLAPCDIPHRTLMDEILPSFKAAVTEANASGVMGSYAEIDGIPCHANKWLMEDVLRKQWGFEGVFVADFGGVDKLCSFHHVVKDFKEAANLALHSGVDMDLPEGQSYRELMNINNLDNQTLSRIDEAVSRVLALKFKLGLFENPYVELDKTLSIVHCDKHKQLAQKAADESVILLKNDNNALPLSTEKIKSVAVIGPHSKLMDIGITIYDGIKSKFPSDIEIKWAQGCALTQDDETISYLQETEEAGFSELHNAAFCVDENEETTEGVKKPKLVPLALEKIQIQEAVDIAKSCDVTILCIGESEHCCGENYAPNRYCDRDQLTLIGNQLELLRQIKSAGAKVVTVLVHGRPLAIGEVAAYSDALISVFVPGEMRGTAVAKALLGEVNPSGKLPVTMPISAGQVPCHYSQRSSGFTKEYAFVDGKYVFPFGYGLSYTTFEYSNILASKEIMKFTDINTISVDVTNTGDRDGDEVVQLYIRDTVSAVTRPAMLLKGFKRVTLAKGETKKVVFELKEEDLAYTGVHGEFRSEPGEFIVYVGGSSRKKDLISTRFELVI